MRSPTAATALRGPIARRPIPPKAAARFAAGAFRATLLAIPTRTVRQPRAVVALATIKTSGTGEKKKTLARPAKRFGKDVAAAVAVLGSDDASCITGVGLAVDGDRTWLQPASCAVPRHIVRIIYANARRIYGSSPHAGAARSRAHCPKGGR